MTGLRRFCDPLHPRSAKAVVKLLRRIRCPSRLYETKVDWLAVVTRSSAENRREGIVLIDGDQLASLMIDHGVGVERGQTVEITRVDHGFFEEG